MANIGSYFEDEEHNIVHLIDAKNTTQELPRHYLGMSQLGDNCSRKLWYYFRFTAMNEIDGRVNRIFATGHKAEADMVRDLESIGIETWGTIDDQEEFSAISGHLKGHGDGFAKGIPGAEKTTHLLEFKTSSAKYFKKMVKEGVKIAKPVHAAQTTLYMHFSKTTRALYMMYCKDTSAYYTERLRYDKYFAEELLDKAERIITSEDVEEFQKIGSGNASYFECKFCDFSDVCHYNALPVKTCRTCTSVSILDDGKWGCGLRNDQVLSLDEQVEACDNYNILECFD